MRDPNNPTAEEIREWAWSGAPEPVEDWDLIVAYQPNEPMYLELAADDGCPARGFFLRLLYLLVRDAVRTDFRSRSRAEILDLLEHSRPFEHPDLDYWRERTRELLRKPDTFAHRVWRAARDGT